MKRKALALVIPAAYWLPALLTRQKFIIKMATIRSHGKVDGLHYISPATSKDGDQTYCVIFKGETQHR